MQISFDSVRLDYLNEIRAERLFRDVQENCWGRNVSSIIPGGDVSRYRRAGSKKSPRSPKAADQADWIRYPVVWTGGTSPTSPLPHGKCYIACQCSFLKSTSSSRSSSMAKVRPPSLVSVAMAKKNIWAVSPPPVRPNSIDFKEPEGGSQEVRSSWLAELSLA